MLLLSTAAADDAATADAKALYAQGKQAFEGGRTTEALADFEAAYAKKALPGFLFNIGLCHRTLKNHGKAVDALERYLRALPNAPNRVEAENMLDEERALAAAATASPPAAPTGPAPPPPPAVVPPPPPPSGTAPPVVTPPTTSPAPPPAAVEPLTPEAVPSPTKPVPDPKAKSKPKPDEPLHGMDALPVGAVQAAAGVGACVGGCCVFSPFACLLNFVPLVGPFVSACAGALIIGSSIGVAEVWLGDWLGKKRGALLWPTLVAVGALAASSLVGTTVTLVTGASPSFNNGALSANPVVTGIVGGVSCCGLATAVVGPAVLYQMLAVDKEPGDTGGGFPGITEPADPTGTRGKGRVASWSPPRAALAMRY